MNAAYSAAPILIELDERTYNEQLDSVAAWFGNLRMTQAEFRRLAEDAANAIHEPHIKAYIGDMAAQAREHEGKIDELYRTIGREPASGVRNLGGTLLAKASEVVGQLQSAAGGAVGNWPDIRQLLITNVDAMGAYAIAEQLELALGLPAIVDITFPIINEKSMQQLLLQEYMLEMAPNSLSEK